MKATEVRIGNWVYINNRHLMKVSSISIDSGIMCIAHVPENNCYPIPLNRDIILQCGFGEVGMYENVYHKDNIRIHFDKNCKDDETGTVLFIVYNDDESIFRKEVSSLHQFQNLYFALFGKELECAI
ncbi:MAG: hypothetical protein LBS55_03225 [Prevotellaceae bacterium]|jgi:hypothetical protein|nr:hypothetical protein [Prevotellaceae bacterium]